MRWDGNGARVARLLIGDSQPLLADALAALLAARGFDVRARVHDTAAVANAMHEQAFDIALLAADLVTEPVLAVLDGLRRNGRFIALVAAATGPDDPQVDTLLGGCCDGLVLKDGSSEWLFHCLTSVGVGGQWHDPRAIAGRRARREVAVAAGVLTRRETEIARHVAGGRRNRDIAETLGISEGTVKMHLHNAFAKLGLESRTQLAMDARVRTLA